MVALADFPRGGFRLVIDGADKTMTMDCGDADNDAKAVTVFKDAVTSPSRRVMAVSGFLFDRDNRLIARTVAGAASIFLVFIFGILKPSLCTKHPLNVTSPNTMAGILTLMDMGSSGDDAADAEDGGPSPTPEERSKMKAAREKFAVSSSALPARELELEGARPPCPSIFLDSN
jgi:hypothetical protein